MFSKANYSTYGANQQIIGVSPGEMVFTEAGVPTLAARRGSQHVRLRWKAPAKYGNVQWIFMCFFLYPYNNVK